MLKFFKKFTQVSLIAIILAFVSLPVAASAQDCDSNAIIRCGITSENLQQKYAANQGGNVQAIFKEFGINNSDALKGMVMGQVTRDNRVLVNGKVVATNAYTTGRQRLSASDVPILGGAAYKRQPSVSFRSSSLSALVKMNGERFAYAIIFSCGNPVTATPTAPEQPVQPVQPQLTPGFEVTKQVRQQGESTWLDETNSKAGNQVQFRLSVRNTGQVSFTNIVLRDTLPVGFTANAGSVTVVGGPLSGDLFRAQGLSIGPLAVGQTREVIFSATISSNVEACTEAARNVVKVKPDNLPEKEADATVKVCKPPVQPVAQVVTVQASPPPPAPVLPVTGPASMLGIFVGTSAAGTLAYRYLLGRKYNG